MMLKLQVITPLCVLFVLQVFSAEASQPKFSCGSLCGQVDFGYAGICCGKIKNIKVKKKLFLFVTGHEYCDCDSGSDIPLVCPPDELFCTAIGEEFKRLKILIYIFSKKFFRRVCLYIWTTMQ